MCVHIDPSPMMPVDPVRVLCSPGQLEQEYRTEMKKVGTIQFGIGMFDCSLFLYTGHA